MNKSVVLKNRIILYFSFLITFFIFLYLVYFLVYGQRGLLQYFYLSKQNHEYNEELAKAVRVADFLELGELFAKDALERNESCGGHFREEYQTKDGEAIRDDKNFKFVSAWEYVGEPSDAKLHKEDLKYEEIEVKTRSYK